MLLSRKPIYIAIVFLAVVMGVLPILVSAQENVDAVADAMCNPFIPACPCGQVVNPQGGCMAGANMNQCPCAGPHASGICIAANKCQATSVVAQSGQSGGGITQLSQLMSSIGQLLQSLGQSSGGGSGGSSGASTGCATYTQTSVPNSTDPCSYYVPDYSSTGGSLRLNGTTDTSAGSSAASDLLSSLIGSSNTNTNTNTDSSNTNSTGSSTSNLLGNISGSVTPSTQSSLIATVSNPHDLTPGTSAAVSQNAFGSAPGITGDIQVLSGNRVTMLASNRDVSGNKQTSGFFGFGTTIGEDTHDIYAQVCAAHEWANNFLATIIPVSYYDNLCVSHGYSITPPPLQPATPPPAPAPSPVAKATSTPQYLGPLKADIWVSPATISSGSRTSLFWSASGVLTCQVSSPSGVLGSALSGSAAVGPLSQSTTYSIACQSATSSVSKQATVTVQ